MWYIAPAYVILHGRGMSLPSHTPPPTSIAFYFLGLTRMALS